MRKGRFMDELDAVARTEIQPGWRVHDADDREIGLVDRVTDESFTVRSNGPVESTIQIGFDDIESADDGRVVLAVVSDELIPAVEEMGDRTAR